MLCNPYDTPTFKTEALHLVTNERWLKRLLLQYKQLIQLVLFGCKWQRISPFLSHITHPFLQLKRFSIEGWLKHLLLQYKWLIQPYLSLLWL